MFFDFLRNGVEGYAGGPDDESRGEFMFSDVAGPVFCAVPDSIFGDFGDAGIGDDVDFVVLEFTFCVVADFLVVGVEDVRLTLYDMNGDLFS